MRKILPLLLFVFLMGDAVGQSSAYPDTVNFESSKNVLIKIDTTQPNNLWQIGAPHKILFDSAYTRPNAIVTDTVNYYPFNNTSSFQFSIYDSAFLLYGFSHWENLIPYVSFMHKYNTDTLRDGGYVEYSLDSGSTWTNVDTLFPWIYNYGNSLYDGTHGFTGRSNGWDNCSFSFDCFGGHNTSFVIIRFTFKSDSINTNKEGWMIDNICWGSNFCEGVKENTNNNDITLYPNPCGGQLTVNSEQLTVKEIKIYNLLGQCVYQSAINNQYTININQLPSGLYFAEIKTEKGIVRKKVVKE